MPKESNDNCGRVQFTQSSQTQNGGNHNADHNSDHNADHNSNPIQAMSDNNSNSGNQVMGDDNYARFGQFSVMYKILAASIIAINEH